MVLTEEKKYTVEEYFKLEASSNIRHEYYYGKLIPMAGESKNANRLASFFVKHFGLLLETKGVEIFTHDIKTQVDKEKIYRYPDVVFAPMSDDNYTHLVTQPIVIVEILSDSTANTDYGDKFREYLKLPTLQHYLIISQKKKAVDIYSRQSNENQWIYTFFSEDEEIIKISTLDISFTLKQLYERVQLE